MRAENALEAAHIVDALDYLDGVDEDADNHLAQRNVFLRISVFEQQGDGGVTHSSTRLPMTVAHLVLQHARESLYARAAALGLTFTKEEESNAR